MKEPTRPSEKRRSPRIEVDLPVTLNWGKKQYRWRARQFSEFGILLATSQKELVGQDVELSLDLDSFDSDVALSGIVAYATDGGIAVRFKNLTADQRATLRAFINIHHKAN